MTYLVALDLADRPVLVVGGGQVALRKVEGLLDAGAAITVVAPDVHPGIEAHPSVRVERRAYAPGDAADHRLVVAATDDPQVNQAVYDDAEALGIWCNVADDPRRSSCFLPAVVRRGSVTVAVSTGGRSPALAAWLRRYLDAVLDPDLAELADRVASARAAIQATGRSTQAIDWDAVIEAERRALRTTRHERPPSR